MTHALFLSPHAALPAEMLHAGTLAAPPSGNTGSVTWPWLLGALILVAVLLLAVLRWMRSK